jgi:hypothetical protein
MSCSADSRDPVTTRSFDSLGGTASLALPRRFHCMLCLNSLRASVQTMCKHCASSLEILLHFRKLGHPLLRVTYTWPDRGSHVCRVFRGPSNVQVEQATAPTIVDLHCVTLAGLYRTVYWAAEVNILFDRVGT